MPRARKKTKTQTNGVTSATRKLRSMPAQKVNLIHSEIEFKYDAESIIISDFLRIAQKVTNQKCKLVLGTDKFFEYASNKDIFLRHRKCDDLNQITLKIKDKTNVIRTEYNLNLVNSVSSSTVELFCKAVGFTYNTTLKKRAYIFETKTYYNSTLHMI